MRWSRRNTPPTRAMEPFNAEVLDCPGLRNPVVLITPEAFMTQCDAVSAARGPIFEAEHDPDLVFPLPLIAPIIWDGMLVSVDEFEIRARLSVLQGVAIPSRVVVSGTIFCSVFNGSVSSSGSSSSPISSSGGGWSADAP